MKEVSLVILGEPVGKSRPRYSPKNGRMYTPSKTRRYEDLIREHYLLKYGSNPIFEKGVPLNVSIFASFGVPESASKAEKERLISSPAPKRPDFDNIAKIVCDALNGLAYYDDAQITAAWVLKRYSDKPSVSIMIWEEAWVEIE